MTQGFWLKSVELKRGWRITYDQSFFSGHKKATCLSSKDTIKHRFKFRETVRRGKDCTLEKCTLNSMHEFALLSAIRQASFWMIDT